MQIKYPLAVPLFAVEFIRINPDRLPDDIKEQGIKLRQTRARQHQDDKGQADQGFVDWEAFFKEKSDKDWQNGQDKIDIKGLISEVNKS